MSLEWIDKVDGVDDVLAEDINGIAHQVIDNKKEISNKVSKEDGKGLSSNDFTNEYKNKVDNFKSPVQSVAGKIGDVILDKNDVGLSQVDNTSDLEKPISNATQKALGKKANKEDIVSAYRFCGSVEKFEDLPVSVKIIPKGNPTLNGVEVGTFNAEERSITFNKEITYYGYDVQIPIEDIVLPKGEYYVNDYNASVCGVTEYDHYFSMLPVEVFEETTVTVIGFGESQSEHIKSGKYYLGTVNTVYYDENGVLHPSIIKQGDVYNVIEGGMNYAWTGDGWDALGGEHKDLEARADIENLETQLGDIETALDSIIEIQNSLIGGETV